MSDRPSRRSKSESRQADRLMARVDVKKGTKSAVEQYAKGMVRGMHLAYVSIARKMLSEGWTEAEVRQFFKGLVAKDEIASILADARGQTE